MMECFVRRQDVNPGIARDTIITQKRHFDLLRLQALQSARLMGLRSGALGQEIAMAKGLGTSFKLQH